VTSSRLVDGLHIDMTCVLIEGHKWEIQWSQQSLAVEIWPWVPLIAMEKSGEGTKKAYWQEKLSQWKISTKTRLQDTRNLEKWL